MNISILTRLLALLCLLLPLVGRGALFPPFTNTASVFVNSNGVKGVRGVATLPYPYFADAVSNAASGDTLFLYGQTTLTNTAQTFGQLGVTNLSIVGYGNTLALTNSIQNDQIWLSGNVSIRDLYVTNGVYHPSFYTFLMTATLTNLFMDNVQVYAHGPCMYADDNTKNKTLDINNCLFLQDCQTNAGIAFGGGQIVGKIKNTSFVSIGTTNNQAIQSAGNEALVITGGSLIATNGRAENVCYVSSDGDTNVFTGADFQVSKSLVAYSVGVAGDAAILYTGYTVPQDIRCNFCTFNLAANGPATLLLQEINYNDGTSSLGIVTFNNVFVRPASTAVIVENVGSTYYVTGGNLQPSNFRDPTKVVWLTEADSAFAYPTNAGTIVPNFNIKYSSFRTNASFTFSAPINISSANYQPCVIIVTNSSGSLINVTGPTATGCHTNGTWNVTNVTTFSFFRDPNGWTNAIAYPIW